MNPCILVLVAQFISIIIALISLPFCFYIVVLKKIVSCYSRFCLGFVILGLTILCTTSGGVFLEMLNDGFVVYDETTFGTSRRHIWLCIRSYGGFILVTSEFLSSLEKLISIISPKFHSTNKFTILFSIFFLLSQFGAFCQIYFFEYDENGFGQQFMFIVTNVLEISNFFTLIFLYYYSKRLYFKTHAKIKLQYRYQLAVAYQWCQCILPPSIFSIIFRIIILSNVWISNLFSDEATRPYLFFIIDLMINIYCMTFPWAILLIHPKFKKQVLTTFRFHVSKVSTIEATQIRSINGIILNPALEQDVYFEQLKAVWRD